jgi:hypothetical protein
MGKGDSGPASGPETGARGVEGGIFGLVLSGEEGCEMCHCGVELGEMRCVSIREMRGGFEIDYISRIPVVNYATDSSRFCKLRNKSG